MPLTQFISREQFLTAKTKLKDELASIFDFNIASTNNSKLNELAARVMFDQNSYQSIQAVWKSNENYLPAKDESSRLHSLNPEMDQRIEDFIPSSVVARERSQLTNTDHDNMDAFLAQVLSDFKDGRAEQSEVSGAIAHVIAAIDQGNYGEARSWLREGRKYIQAKSSSLTEPVEDWGNPSNDE